MPNETFLQVAGTKQSHRRAVFRTTWDCLLVSTACSFEFPNCNLRFCDDVFIILIRQDIGSMSDIDPANFWNFFRLREKIIIFCTGNKINNGFLSISLREIRNRFPKGRVNQDINGSFFFDFPFCRFDFGFCAFYMSLWKRPMPLFTCLISRISIFPWDFS